MVILKPEYTAINMEYMHCFAARAPSLTDQFGQ